MGETSSPWKPISSSENSDHQSHAEDMLWKHIQLCWPFLSRNTYHRRILPFCVVPDVSGS